MMINADDGESMKKKKKKTLLIEGGKGRRSFCQSGEEELLFAYNALGTHREFYN